MYTAVHVQSVRMHILVNSYSGRNVSSLSDFRFCQHYLRLFYMSSVNITFSCMGVCQLWVEANINKFETIGIATKRFYQRCVNFSRPENVWHAL